MTTAPEREQAAAEYSPIISKHTRNCYSSVLPVCSIHSSSCEKDQQWSFYTTVCDFYPHQDSLDLELGASASRVAPHPPRQRRRSSGWLMMLMLIVVTLLIVIQLVVELILCHQGPSIHRIGALWSNFNKTMSKQIDRGSAKRHLQVATRKITSKQSLTVERLRATSIAKGSPQQKTKNLGQLT